MKRYLLVAIFSAISFSSVMAQSYKMHTVFIFSFTRYIQWPDAYNGGDFEILVLGDSPIIEELKAMAQVKKVGDRAIKVTKINNVAEIRKCNILFIPTAKSPQIAEVLAKITTQSILVVTEEQGMGAKGSNVNFVTKDGKLAFELNQNATTKQGLKVSNELSRLAILI
jgi:hypothetical protein